LQIKDRASNYFLCDSVIAGSGVAVGAGEPADIFATRIARAAALILENINPR
jgi:hypothetical protein